MTSPTAESHIRPQFRIGEQVRVRFSLPRGHVRTPYYARGKTGVVADYVGNFVNPEHAALGGDGLPELPLYRVRFAQEKVWPDYRGRPQDTLDVEVYEHWLEPARSARPGSKSDV